MSAARLVPVHEPSDPDGVVLVLHGGASRQASPMVRPTQLSVLRMIPVARRIARADRDLAVYRVLNSKRGWDATHTPVDDAWWALDQVIDRLGASPPAALVGHSLGGRAALLAGTRDEVRAVVALNPWVYADDGVGLDLAGRRVLVAHGDQDRVADPARAEAVSRSISKSTDVEHVVVRGGKHAMLRRGRVFERLAADFVAESLRRPTDAGEPGLRQREV